MHDIKDHPTGYGADVNQPGRKHEKGGLPFESRSGSTRMCVNRAKGMAGGGGGGGSTPHIFLGHFDME